MGERNKILDVTYGNFACRLEGFDDSVETLKAIVGYFQEISSDDTFTSDAPKTPDLETLARLAENHTDGTVEIESDGEQLSLRVQQDAPEAEGLMEDLHADDAAAEAEEPEVSTDDDEVSDLETDNVFAHRDDDPVDHLHDDDDASVLSADDGEEMRYENDADEDGAPTSSAQDPAAPPTQTTQKHAEQQASVADKLQRIRAVVGRGRTPEVAQNYGEDITETLSVSGAAATNPLAQRLADLAKRNSDLMDADAERETPEIKPSDPLHLGTPERIDAAADEQSENTQDTDDRTKSEVLALTDPVAPEEDLTENIAVEDIADAVSAMSEGTDAQASEAEDIAPDAVSENVTEDPNQETEVADTPAEDDDVPAVDTTKAETVEVETDAETPRETQETLQTDDVADETTAEAVDDTPVAADESTEITPEAAVEEEPDPIAEEASADADDDVSEADLNADALDTAAEETDAEAQEVSDTQADLPDETSQTAPDDEAAPTESRPLLLTPQGQSGDEDDFDLEQEVAALARELEARPGNELARHGLPRSVEDAMSRILMETNQHLDEPESKRHRDAFAQLKAAVAATEAARQLGDAAKSRDIGEQYRSDFGELEAAENAKDANRPSLTLVTDKNRPAGATVSHQPDPTSARLRQIAAMKEADQLDTAPQNFASFAKSKGASELADLLEAAAAYISYVDGDSDFSRPQVMKVAQTAADKEITREDGLRSFGRLLRQSRIVKLNNGRFQVSDNTRFKPTSNRAARG